MTDLSRARISVLPLLFLASPLGNLGCSKQDESAESPSSTWNPAEESQFPKVGAPAPEFEGVAHSGQTLRLSDLRDKVVVLYFYPKDGTPGCTKEAQGFRDEYEDFEQAGAVIVGVSTQDNESHRAFAKKHKLPFVLLPDEDSKIAKSYGVGAIFGFTKRVTFVIDRQGKIARIYEKVSPPGHAKEILDVVVELGERPTESQPTESQPTESQPAIPKSP